MTIATSRPQPVQRYNRTAMVLHWLVAALILINVVAGLAAQAKGEDPSARPLIDLHKSIGLTILGLVVLRLLWRWARRPPPLPQTWPASPSTTRSTTSRSCSACCLKATGGRTPEAHAASAGAASSSSP